MTFNKFRGAWVPLFPLALTALSLVWIADAPAGQSLFRNTAVGGVAIDTQGVLSQPPVEVVKQFAEELAKQARPVPQKMNEASQLRRVSLKQLVQALRTANAAKGELPDELRYLAGIQRLKYIFVYPEEKDIVLAGPGEGWTVDPQGYVVGVTTGRPVIQLDDLLVALRSVDAARQGGITCSIDPTEEGMARFQALNTQLKRSRTEFSLDVLKEMENAWGPQQITFSGVPETSHFARVLVAADYRMKRIAMQLESSPVAALPSYLEMLANSRLKVTTMTPRWWMACDYEPLARSEDGLAWELRGPGVKVETEDTQFNQDGSRDTNTGRKTPLAQKWAETMSANYDELSAKEPIFAQLRNLMDLSVVAAIIERNGLVEKADCDLGMLTSDASDLTLAAWNPPKTVATSCSFTKRGREYLVTASGGVQIESWRVAEASQVNPRLGGVHQNAKMTGDSWWK
jgi:hypothetical protein